MSKILLAWAALGASFALAYAYHQWMRGVAQRWEEAYSMWALGALGGLAAALIVLKWSAP